VEPSAVPVFVPPVDLTTDKIEEIESGATKALGEGAHLVVDLARTSFVSSGGLGLLVRLAKTANDRGGRLAVARPQPPIVKLLKMVGLDGVLPMFPTVDAAARHAAARHGPAVS
jgi:anti-anti-sigma factor